MKSDSEMRIEMRAEVTRQLGSRADDIEVQYSEGIVTLAGSLRSDLERWNLREALRGMPGVDRVMDETAIVPEPSMRSPDADVARPWFPAE